MLNSLRRLLAQDETIIFVGSGISRWSGLPSWEKLIDELADYLETNDIDAALVRREAATGDLVQAASYGFMKLTPSQTATFMRAACRTGSAVPAAIHQAILALGPSCFITTNYDDLLEEAYRQHRPAPSELRVVLNTQLIEQAEIIHAQARQFIFKPHGDARQAGSIVLTREHYRMLLPEGPLSATLNTFKTLLQSRPVLFLGFGLRDPDFLHLRDLLSNIYRGGLRDHYAIVADPVRDQEDYWRTHYGIHLIGYATADQGRDHNGLLAMLEQLSPAQAMLTPQTALDVNDPAAVLALARYAASCLTPSASERFVIHVSKVEAAQRYGDWQALYHYWSVERLLHEGPSQVILLGEPGAGKSFAMRETVNTIASGLQDACLRGNLAPDMRIPIAIDLKYYEGSLLDLISGKFSDRLCFEQLYAGFHVTLYLDGYNELPRAFREDGSFDRQLDELLEAKPRLGLVIGSRTTDGLERRDLPAFRLAEIAAEEVERRLKVSGVALPTTHRCDIVGILQRPFYFRLLDRALMSLADVSAPSDLYGQFIASIQTRFAAAFDVGIDLVAALQRHAFATLEQGSEAFAVSDLEAAIAAVAPQLTQAQIEQIANWLAAEEVIIPMRGQRAAFVHQSVTEFLAACELKIQLEQETGDADKLINLRRWDNAIFMALGMLDEPLAAVLLGEITARDVNFALDAARFVQHGGEALIGQLLNIVAEMPDTAFDYETGMAFNRLPLAPSHEPALRRILSLPTLRGRAFGALTKALDLSVKQEIIDCLFTEGPSGPIREIGRALAHLLRPEDLPVLVDRLTTAEPSSFGDENGVTQQQIDAVASAIHAFPPEDIRRATIARFNEFDAHWRSITATLICEVFVDNASADGMAMVIEVARAKLPSTLFTLYLNTRFNDDLLTILLDALDDELFEAILYYVDHGDRWSVELLETCVAKEAVRSRVLAEAKQSSGIRRHVLEYCATRNANALLAALQACSSESTAEQLALLQLINFPELDWSGHHDLLVALLARHDLVIARMVLGGTSPPSFTGLDSIDLGAVEPWLNWLIQLSHNEDGPTANEASWVAMQLSALIARSSAPDNKAQLFKLLKEGTPTQNWTVAAMILPEMEGLSMADFSAETLDLLKALVVRGQSGNPFRPHVFTRVADEMFLRNELLPLAMQGEEAHDAVFMITREAGKRLGIRLAPPPLSQCWPGPFVDGQASLE